MSENGTVQALKDQKIPEAPSGLRTLLALNTAIASARASEADKEYIAAALKVKTLADFE
jgi:hypothetical protein